MPGRSGLSFSSTLFRGGLGIFSFGLLGQVFHTQSYIKPKINISIRFSFLQLDFEFCMLFSEKKDWFRKALNSGPKKRIFSALPVKHQRTLNNLTGKRNTPPHPSPVILTLIVKMRSTGGKSGLDHILKPKWVGRAGLGSGWVRVRGGSWDGHQGRDSGNGNGGGGGSGGKGKRLIV